jgi:hypothetical protein
MKHSHLHSAYWVNSHCDNRRKDQAYQYMLLHHGMCCKAKLHAVLAMGKMHGLPLGCRLEMGSTFLSGLRWELALIDHHYFL